MVYISVEQPQPRYMYTEPQLSHVFQDIEKNIATADKAILGVGCMMHAQYIYVRLKALLRAREKAKGLLLYIHFKY